MMNVHQYILNRRALHHDTVTAFIKTASAINAGIVFIAIYLIFYAQPVSFSALDANLGIRTTWDPQAISYLFALMIVGLGIGAAGLIANSKRLKRRYDHIRKNFVLMIGVSLIGIVAYLAAA